MRVLDSEVSYVVPVHGAEPDFEEVYENNKTELHSTTGGSG